MRPEGVVFPAVVLDDHAGFGEGPELLTVKAFVTEASVEALQLPLAFTISTHTLRSFANRGSLICSICPSISLKFFAIPQWWLPLGEVPLVSPKDFPL